MRLPKIKKAEKLAFSSGWRRIIDFNAGGY
jgi:hypothetical protein